MGSRREGEPFWARIYKIQGEEKVRAAISMYMAICARAKGWVGTTVGGVFFLGMKCLIGNKREEIMSSLLELLTQVSTGV